MPVVTSTPTSAAQSLRADRSAPCGTSLPPRPALRESRPGAYGARLSGIAQWAELRPARFSGESAFPKRGVRQQKRRRETRRLHLFSPARSLRAGRDLFIAVRRDDADDASHNDQRQDPSPATTADAISFANRRRRTHVGNRSGRRGGRAENKTRRGEREKRFANNHVMPFRINHRSNITAFQRVNPRRAFNRGFPRHPAPVDRHSLHGFSCQPESERPLCASAS